jgi:hypothetical protein
MDNPCTAFLPLGAAQCAKSVVLPSDFMQNGGAAPLVGAAAEPSKLSWVPLAVGAALVGGVLWFVAKGATPVLANPGLPDGVAKRKHFTARDADPRELARGTKHEMEHTSSRRIARQIALDHLAEDSRYYTKLERMERAP